MTATLVGANKAAVEPRSPPAPGRRAAAESQEPARSTKRARPGNRTSAQPALANKRPLATLRLARRIRAAKSK